MLMCMTVVGKVDRRAGGRTFMTSMTVMRHGFVVVRVSRTS